MSDHPAKAYLRPEASLDDGPIQFFPVDPGDVAALTARMGVVVPDHVLRFWSEVGYGFVNASLDGTKSVCWTNLIMSPARVAKVLRGNGQAMKASRERPPWIPVFSADEDAVFCAAPDGTISCVHDAGVILAASLSDLAERLLGDPGFYVPLAWPEHGDGAAASRE